MNINVSFPLTFVSLIGMNYLLNKENFPQRIACQNIKHMQAGESEITESCFLKSY